MPRRIIIDTDPGQDDALALLLAMGATDELALLGITTVAGNVSVDQTTHNALRICQLAARADVPVHPGCARPILRPLHTAEFVCGVDGLSGMDIPPPRHAAMDMHAVTFLIDTVRRAREPVTICALGPLTNVALALIQAPDIAADIAGVAIMGGARDLGNMTAAAEFNFFVDPHAAAVVFGAGLDLTLFPLNATYQAVATPPRVAGFAAHGPVGRAVRSMLRRERPGGAALGGAEGHPMHDPCVVAWLLWPDLFAGRRCRVDVETAEGPTVGRSTIDWWGRGEAAPNALVIDTIDADAMFARMADAIAPLDALADRHAGAC